MRETEYNLVVIGGGSAGLVSAYLGAAVKAKVALIEKKQMGGDCLNTGCVPSKALLKSAKIYSLRHRGPDFGIRSIQMEMQFSEVMERVKKTIRRIAPNDSVERYNSLGVACFQGEAQLLSKREVVVDGKLLRAKSLILATGARPFLPPLEGLAEAQPLTSDSVWDLESLPSRLLILGGGAIGCEMAQAFQRLGSKVILLERNDRLLPKEDPEVGAFLKEKFEREGMQVILGAQAVRFSQENGERVLFCQDERKISFDRVLVALGRKANVQGFGLEKLGVKLTETGAIATDAGMRTNVSGVFACGDVTGKMQFTHFASLSASTAVVNALFWPYRKKINLTAFPWAIYTDPEIARVGLNEMEALQKGIDYQVTQFPLSHSDRAITEEEAEGFVKVLTVPGKDLILGATIVGPSAGELIQEFNLAMGNNLGLNAILHSIHAYPTLMEVNRALAGAWKRESTSSGALSFLQAFHRLRRRF